MKNLHPTSRLGWSSSLLLLLPVLALAQPIPPTQQTEAARYIFAVYTPQSAAEATIWKTTDTELTTHRLLNRQDSAEIRLAPVGHTSLRTYVDLGAVAGAVQRTTEQGSPTLHELLAYDQLLSPAQRQLTESYLAIKHGLTLDQALPTNYLALAPDGATYPVWTATEDRSFRHRIFGLARDTAVGLERFSGSSVLEPKLLHLNWPAPPTATAYLLLADDDAPTARIAEDQEIPGLQRLQRKWRLEASGAVPATVVTLDMRRLFGRARAGERWVLLLSGTSTDVPESVSGISTDVPENDFLTFTLPPLPPGTYHLQLALACPNCPTQKSAPINDFFTSVQVSPNPVVAGKPLQLRVALAGSAGLVVTAFDALGRQVLTQTLPANTHHLAELTFPAPGSYSLHLCSRLLRRAAPQHAIQVIVH